MTDTVTEMDRADIEASLKGDGDAYARLVRRYEKDIAALMWRFTRDMTNLEELVQDAFVEAYMSLKNFGGRGPFLHWLRKVATRVGYRHWKFLAHKRSHEEMLTETLLSVAKAPEDATSSESAEALYRLLEKLQPPDRLILTLFYFEDRDIKSIASQAGWTCTGTKVRLHRARKRLERVLDQAGIRRIADV